ncbi:MAG: ATP-binding protein [Myxococcaceae bacterium]
MLLIDPDQRERDRAQKALEESGFVVRASDSANEALAQLSSAQSQAVVVLDAEKLREAKHLQIQRELEKRVEQKNQELAALQKEHARAEKLAALGTLLAGVVHEIGSPLTVLESALPELLTASPEEQAEMMADARQATSRISRLIQTLRRLSRVNEPRGWSELAPALKESLTLVRDRFPKNANLEMSIDPSVRQVYLGYDDLISVLTNLIINAGHAVEGKPGGGTVKVTLERMGPRAVLTVSDDGTGIKPEHLERVLDPFFTTKPKGKGTGLGLSLVDQLIRAAGGSLSVESTWGVGTSVTAVLRVI